MEDKTKTGKYIFAALAVVCFITAATGLTATAQDEASIFLEVGKTYTTLPPGRTVTRFKVLELGKDGWIKAELEGGIGTGCSVGKGSETVWLNTKLLWVGRSGESEEPLQQEPAQAPAPTPVAPSPKPPSSPANADWWKVVCPAGKPGEFHHGTKCVGYYDYDEKAQKWKVVEILLPGEEPTKNYKKTKGLVHAGADVVAAAGSEIHSIADGTVSDVIADTNDKNFNSLGYMVMVQHKDKSEGKDTFSLYLHMKEPPKVQKGQAVTAGKDVLGYVGQTGGAFGAHVHVEVRHFPERFYVNWRNIYGITSPAEEATFNADEFASNWIDPEKFGSASLQSTTPAATAVANAPNTAGNPVQTPFDKIVAASGLQDANQFNNHVREYAYTSDQVWVAVQQVLTAQGDKVVQADQENRTLISEAAHQSTNPFVSGRVDVYFIWLERTGDRSTTVHLKLVTYRGSKKTPEWKDVVDKAANNFLDKVTQALMK